MLDNCTSTCGWLAAIVSCVGFGTFAVPVKSPSVQSVDVDPLVFHTYKVIMCFLTSFLVLPMGQEFYFTPWGIISSIFWVPASIAAVFAVKNAGLAVSQGTWCTGIVLISFVWGIFIFGERVKSKMTASLAIVLIVSGLWGMSFYSSPEIRKASKKINHQDEEGAMGMVALQTHLPDPLEKALHSMVNVEGNEKYKYGSVVNTVDIPSDIPLEKMPICSIDERKAYPLIPHAKTKFSRRTLGLLAAVFNGFWGGSVFVPMHYAPPTARGIGYVISFAIGAVIVTLWAWIVRFAFLYFTLGMSFEKAFRALPSFHFRTIWRQGALFGTLCLSKSTERSC